jgi:hypothetical protein
MINLLKETLNFLFLCGKKEEDVRWVGTKTHKTTWESFKAKADSEYDNGYGLAKVPLDLLIVGDNWWLERSEYDGSEGWCFKSFPSEPTQSIDLKILTSEMFGKYSSAEDGLIDLHRQLSDYLADKDGPIGHDAPGGSVDPIPNGISAQSDDVT